MPASAPKIFAIGDIHGCHDKLANLLRRLPYDRQQDTLVFLGDYINRGPDSKKVLDLLISLKKTCSNIVFLKGNHEQALLDYNETGDPERLNLLRKMGITATLESYGSTVRQLQGLSAFSAEHRDFLFTLDFAWMTGTTVFTHADISEEMLVALATGSPKAENTMEETMMLSSRRLTRESASTFGYTIVFGHTPFEFPLTLADRIGIDTGAVYGNFLTALELPSHHFYHA